MLRPSAAASGARVFLAIEYAECQAHPVRAMPAGCACDDEACEFSRVRDSFTIECLQTLAPSHVPDPTRPKLCDLINGKQLPVCPACPADPWVVLAQITLPASPATAITAAGIDNVAVRRLVFSTAMIQDQLIDCCCKKPAPAPAPAKLEITLDARILPNLEIPATQVRIHVTNHGPAAAENVSLQHTISAEVAAAAGFGAGSFDTDTGAWGQTDVTNQPLTASLGAMALNAKALLSFVMTNPAGIPEATYDHTADVTCDNLDPSSAAHAVRKIQVGFAL
jgi:hypothetical protein